MSGNFVFRRRKANYVFEFGARGLFQIYPVSDPFVISRLETYFPQDSVDISVDVEPLLREAGVWTDIRPGLALPPLRFRPVVNWDLATHLIYLRVHSPKDGLQFARDGSEFLRWIVI